MKRLAYFFLLLITPALYAKTVSSVAISPQGASLQTGSNLQFSATCTYSDSSTDNCAAAGGAVWSSSRTSNLSVTSTGLATWNSDPGSGHSDGGFVIVSAAGVTDKAGVFGQHPGDTWYQYITPDMHNYADTISGALLPMNVVVGSTIAVGEGLVINVAARGYTGTPLQSTCNWSSSAPNVATVNRQGLVTAVSVGAVTITCGTKGNAVFGSSSESGWVTPGNVITLNIVAGGGGGTTWYIRPNGGTPFRSAATTPAGQCDGKHDADYPGSGVNQPCAFGNMRYLWSDEVSYMHLQWAISGGDTVIVRQNPNGYNVGQDAYGNTLGPCWGNEYGCYMPSIPSGTATQHTRILGENYASCHSDVSKTKLNVSYGASAGINVLDSQFVDVSCFEVTDQAACGGNGNYTNVCSASANAGGNGIFQSALTASVNYNDIFIHGLTHDGISGATGVGIVANYVHIRAAPDAGINMDDDPWGQGNISVAGGFSLTNSTIEFTGCVEEYPVVHNYPYLECRDQSTGGYGDGLGTASTTGDWYFNADLWQYNFQDGLDLLHSGMHSLTVTNSRSIGNDGQAYKIGSGDVVTFQNNIAEVDCNRIAYKIGDEPASAIVPGVSTCRAAGDGVIFNFTDQGKYTVQDNTLVGYNSTMFDLFCEGGWDFCPNAATTFENNVVLGYNNTIFGDGRSPGLFYGENASMPANGGWAVRDHNFYYNMRYCPTPLMTGETCNTASPAFVNQPANPISVESAMDNFNFQPAAGSPLIGAGITLSSILSDINGTVRPNPPSIGAVEFSSSSVSLQSTSLTLVATPSPATAGQSVTLAATITSQGSSTVSPTGTVVFYANGALIGTGTPTAGVASFSTSSLTAGTYTLTASYSGDSVYAASTSGTASLTVGSGVVPIVPVVSLSATPNPATVGQTVALTASVSNTGTVPTGTVTFLNGTTSLGTGTLSSGGVATFSTSSLVAGTYSLTASYGGNSVYAAGVSAADSLTVSPAPIVPIVSLSAAPNPVIAGQTVALTATVSHAGTVPTGTVTFLNGTTSLGTGTLGSGGVATFSTSSLVAGTYSLTASYGGNSVYAAGISAADSLTVSPAAAAVSIAVAQPEFGFNVIPGSTRRVFATVTNGSTNGVTWTVKSGSGTLSSASGSWVDVTAPATGTSCSYALVSGAWTVHSATQFVIEATSMDDPTKSFNLTFNVCNPAVQVDAVPFYRTLYANQPADVQSIVKGSVNQNVHWTITSEPTGGDGALTDSTARDTVFSATVPGRYVLTATSQANTAVSATAIMYVTGNTMPYRVTPNLTEPVDCTVDPALLGTTYDVGPSQTFTTLASVPFPSMNAGSTVRLHNEDRTGLSPTTYHEYVQISQPATATQPIRICGVPDSLGNLPVMDATGARGRSDASATSGGYGLITVQGSGSASVYPNYAGPAYISVEGIRFQNAKAGSSYTAPSGGAASWTNASSAIRVSQVHDFVAVGNDMYSNGMGVYSDFNAASGWGGSTIDLLWEGNHIHGNGATGSSTSHQMYLQGWNEIAQFNRVENFVQEGMGSNLKSRSLGTIIRYNYLGDGPARQLDLVEAQDSATYMTFSGYLNGYPSSFHDLNPTDQYSADLLAAAQEQWNSHYAYGNIFENVKSYLPIHFAYDTVGGEAARKGNLFWYNNTFYEGFCSACTTQTWTLFDTKGDNGVDVPLVEYPTVQIFNNLLWMANTSAPVFQWNDYSAFIGVAGANQISASWGTNVQTGGSGTGWNVSTDAGAYQNAGALSSHATGFGSLTPVASIPFDTTTWIVSSGLAASTSVPSGVCEMPVRFAYLPSLGYAVPRVSTLNMGATDTVAETASTMTTIGGSARYNTRNSNCR